LSVTEENPKAFQLHKMGRFHEMDRLKADWIWVEWRLEIVGNLGVRGLTVRVDWGESRTEWNFNVWGKVIKLNASNIKCKTKEIKH
jgi:hypothetical protein